MNIIYLLLVLAVFGFIFWLVNTYIPMQPPFKIIINVIAVVILVLWLLQLFGLIGGIGSLSLRV